MAIVKMDKFNLLSFDSDRDNLLNTLQGFNYVHFNDLVKESDDNYLTEVRETKKLAEIDESLNKVNYAIDVIRDYTKDLPDELHDKVSDLSLEEVNKRGANFTFDLIYEKLRNLITKREKLVQSRDNLNQKYDDLSPWQDINVNVGKLYKSDRFFLETGTISNKFYEDLQKALVERNLDGTLVYKIGERDANLYVVAISTNKEANEFSDILREFGFTRGT